MVSAGRIQNDHQPLGAPVRGLGLSAKIVLLVACAAIAPAALIGFASYLTVQRIQADEIAVRLADRAASAERQVSRFIDARRIATRTVADSHPLTRGLDEWRRAGEAADGDRTVALQARLASYLSSVFDRDPRFERLAIYDASGTLVAATPAVGPSSGGGAAGRQPAGGDGVIVGAGGKALVQVQRLVESPGGRPLGRLVTRSRLDGLWQMLAGAYDETPERLRIVDGRRHTLFDSAAHPAPPQAALPAPVADQLLDLRVGNAAYANEASVEVVAGHRFVPELDLGLLIELPAAEAAAGRRWREFALAGSVATVGLFAIICSLVAFHLLRPLRSLVRGVRGLDASDPSRRLPVAAADEAGVLTIAFNQLLDALDKAGRHLGRLASIDELTGLFNRRHLEKRFEVELNRANRSSRPLSVLVIDLDHFMAFNDRFGRPQGDDFLRHVSSFLRTWLRATDVLARYGGEEFAALLPDTDRQTAIEIAERLRARFAGSHPKSAGAEVPVTLSIGVATWEGGSTIQADLIEAADRAVVQAKRAGRNRVRFAA